MSKALKARVVEYLEAIKDLDTKESIVEACNDFHTWIIENTDCQKGTLIKYLSTYGLFKGLKAITLIQGVNAESVAKYDGNGNIIGNELKHITSEILGITSEDWNARKSNKVTPRLNNTKVIEPEKYFEATEKLLLSVDSNEVAVGLIAATGRRPHEILARASFKKTDNRYIVTFTGQGKKRGKKPVFNIPVLFPSEYIIERLSWLRKEPGIKEMYTDVVTTIEDVEAQNAAFHSRRITPLNRIVREYFGDEFQEDPALEPRHGSERDSCSSLRSAYLTLAAARDCPPEKDTFLFMGEIAGHVESGHSKDSELKNLQTTLSYGGYKVLVDVPYPEAPEKGKITKITVDESILEQIKVIQERESFQSQRETIKQIVGSFMNTQNITEQLLKTQEENRQLRQQIKTMEETQNQPVKTEVKLIEPTDNSPKEIGIAVKEYFSNRRRSQGKPEWADVDNKSLWESKGEGSSEEKLDRTFQAICLYNDTVAPSNNERLAITSKLMRDLARCHGKNTENWMLAHKDEVISHNSKYGMENKKNPRELITFANKGKAVDTICKIIEETFLKR